jgi:hypothetical protein
VEFVGLAHQGTADAMRDFVERHGLDHVRHGVDSGGALWAHFGVFAQPNWAFVTADGRVEKVSGALSDDELDRRVATLTG